MVERICVQMPATILLYQENNARPRGRADMDIVYMKWCSREKGAKGLGNRRQA